MYYLLKDLTEAVIMALVVFFFLQLSIQNFKVEGSSMASTIPSGDFVTVNKMVYLKVDMVRFSRLIPFWDASDKGDIFPFQPGGPARGQIIVFQFPVDPSRDFVKRVIGLPGEKVSIRPGQVYIDGIPLDEAYLTGQTSCQGRDLDAQDFAILAQGEYFVMGDNRCHSNDSRHWGPVSLEEIIGNRWLSYGLPFDVGIFNPAQ